MTTIVADFRTKIMVSDTRCTYGSNHFRVKKIYVMPDGTLVGFSGSVSEGYKFVEWFEKGCNKKILPSFGEEPDDFFDAISMNNDGMLLWNNSLIPTKINQEYFSIGTGSSYALGALMAGASAERAVAIASELDCASGVPIDCYEYIPLNAHKKKRSQRNKH
jgi:20S proteasome alpha/beta subunit